MYVTVQVGFMVDDDVDFNEFTTAVRQAILEKEYDVTGYAYMDYFKATSPIKQQQMYEDFGLQRSVSKEIELRQKLEQEEGDQDGDHKTQQ